jgi:hypothetical protein
LWRLRHNTARQPIVGIIVNDEPCLQAGDAARCDRENFRGTAQLQTLRFILGIEHAGQRSPREWERDVQGTRLCAR